MPWKEALDGQVAIITGAGSGIGAATARRLSRVGARVALAGRKAEPLEQTADEIRSAGGAALVVPTDVREDAQVDRLVQETVRAFGTVDLLVNNAGVFHIVEMAEMTTELWDETLDTNLRGAYLCARAVWPIFVSQGSGQIINVSSVAAVQAYEGNAAYGAAKAGMNGLSAVLALEGRRHGIRVHTICPGATGTPIWKGTAGPEVLSRMMPPEDIAEIVRWLASSPPGLSFEPLIVRNLRDPWDVER